MATTTQIKKKYYSLSVKAPLYPGAFASDYIRLCKELTVLYICFKYYIHLLGHHVLESACSCQLGCDHFIEKITMEDFCSSWAARGGSHSFFLGWGVQVL